MKKWMNLVTILGIGGALVVLGDLHFSTSDAVVRTPVTASVEKGPAIGLRPFDHFTPETPRELDFDVEEETFADLTDRQKRDQLLDWALFAVLADSDTDAEGLAEIVHDLPPIRSGYLKPVADFEYGPTRSRYIGKGRVVALIPAAATPEERRDHLAHVADAHRKDLGEKPETLLTFEYELDVGRHRGRVVRRGDVGSDELFSVAYGYVEQSIAGAGDFTHFMGEIDDVTFARIERDALRLGGRALSGRPYRGIRVEDVAAIWQAEKRIQETLPELETYMRRCSKISNLTELVERALSGRSYRGTRVEDVAGFWQGEKGIQVTFPELKAYENRRIRQCKKDAKDLARKQGSTHIPVDGSGFSLDPTPKYRDLIAALDEWNAESTLSALRQKFDKARRKLAEQDIPIDGSGCSSKYCDLITAFDEWLAKGGFLAYRQELDKVRRQLAEEDVGPYLAMADRLQKSSSFMDLLIGTMMEALFTKSRFQAARYDGDLQGTEVGMVLFYTDLLAKLWAIDFLSNAPDEEDIHDFRPEISLSPVFKEECRELSSTRLWFGPQDYGFQVTDNGLLLFARNATRIYAASSNNLRPGEETEPNAQSEAFLGWWNDHYGEVARHEPEYERLNEIMKWSLLISWLNENGQGEHIAFLAEHSVVRDNWFPDWVDQRALRFSQWPEVGFFPRGTLDTITEALPILRSEPYALFGEEAVLSGGVSLAKRGVFKTRQPLQMASRSLRRLRRSGIDYKSLTDEKGAFRTLAGGKHQLRRLTPLLSAIDSTPRQAAKLRTPYGELRNTAFQRSIARDDGWLSIETDVGGKPFGRLEVERTGNGFRVGWRGRDLDAAHSLARRLSRAENLERALADDSRVEAAAKLGDGEFVARPRGSNSWVKLAPEKEPSVELADGWTSRVCDPIGGKHNIQLNLLSEAPKNVVHLKPPKPRPKPPIARQTTRGPPVEAIAKRDFRTAARLLAEDPDAFKKSVDTHGDARLAEIDGLLADGRTLHALEALDKLDTDVGETPESRLRRGLLLLERGKPQEAAKVLADAPRRTPRRMAGFLDEINRRLERPELKGVERDNLHRLGQYADWRAQQAKRPQWAGKVLLMVKDGRFELSVELPKDAPLQRLTTAEVEGLAGRDPVLYVQDSPGLNNLDWSNSVQKSLNEVVSVRGGAVFRLPRGDIAHYNPAKIYAPEVSPTALQRVGNQTVMRVPTRIVAYPGPSPIEDEDDQEIFLVVDGNGR